MASTEKTKFIVATGIMACVLGLGFIAISGTSAMSEGYGTRLDVSSLEIFSSRDAGACIAQKGAKSCLNGQPVAN